MVQIIAEIYDLYNNHLEDIKGDFEKGSFKYQEGGIKIFGFTVNGKEKKLDCDFKGMSKKGKYKYVSYVFDGINYKQRFFNDSKIESNFDLYLSDVEKGILSKELSLEKPVSLKEIIEFMFFALVIGSIAMLYFISVQIQASVKPIQNVSIALQYYMGHSQNQTLELFKEFNQSSQINKELLAYLIFNATR